MNAPQTRGEAIQPDVSFVLPDGTRVDRYAVNSNTEDQPHGVTVVNDVVFGCSCLGFRYRWGQATFHCRHMKIIREQLAYRPRPPEPITVDALVSQARSSREEKFYRNYYPYDYAVRMLVEYPELAPKVVVAEVARKWSFAPSESAPGTWSRAFASCVLNTWNERLGRETGGQIACVLGYAFLVVNEIEIPVDLPKPAGLAGVDL